MSLSWKDLAETPVAKAFGVDFNPSGDAYLLTAQTGSGKTMIVPILECLSVSSWKHLEVMVDMHDGDLTLKDKRRILLRQPTRGIARAVQKSLNMFWGDLGINIGLLTSDHSIGNVRTNDITVVTDGIMRKVLDDLGDDLTIIIDEVHWMTEFCEIELALLRELMLEGSNHALVFLSATINPINLMKYFEDLNPGGNCVDYHMEYVCGLTECSGNLALEINHRVDQPQFLKVYYAEGVIFPVKKRVEIIKFDKDLKPAIEKWCESITRRQKRGLLFLTTRAEVQTYADALDEKGVTVMYAHADVPIDDIIDFVEENCPSVVVSTVALATSITLPFDEVMIHDSAIKTFYKNGAHQVERGGPLDNNSILQKAGRVGRVKEGTATLLTSQSMRIAVLSGKRGQGHKEVWNAIHPVPIEPPLQSADLIDVIMSCASYGLKLSDTTFLSDLDPIQLTEASFRAQVMGLVSIKPNDGTVELTEIGRKVMNFPIASIPALVILTAPERILPLVVAAYSWDCDLIRIFTDKGVKWQKNHPRLGFRSAYGVKAWILREGLQARLNQGDSLPKYANRNEIWNRRIDTAAYQFGKLAKLVGSSYQRMRQDLIDTKIDMLEMMLVNHLDGCMVFDKAKFWVVDKGRITSTYKNLTTLLARAEAPFLRIGGGDIDVIGKYAVIDTKRGRIGIFNDVSIVRP